MDTTPHRDRRLTRTVDRLLSAVDRLVRAAETAKRARQDLDTLIRRQPQTADAGEQPEGEQ